MTRPRELEIWLMLEEIKNMKHEFYRGVDFTWACKFRSFYKGSMNHMCPIVPLSRFGLFSQRKPIATCFSECVSKKPIPYKLGLSMSWKKQVDRMHEFFKYNCIKEVHVNEDISIIKNLFVQVAKLYNVKTFVHMHGAIGQWWGFLPLTADKIIVWDERNKSRLVSLGLEPERIDVGGYQERYWPILSKLTPATCDRVRHDLKLDDRKIILFAPYTLTNYGDGGEDKILDGINMIKQAILKLSGWFDTEDVLPDMNIVVKLHPASKDMGYWKKWRKENLLNFTIVKDYNSYDLAYASHLMVVQSSTYAIDGLMMKKNVIVLDTGFFTGVEEYGYEFELVKNIDKLMNRISFFGK